MLAMEMVLNAEAVFASRRGWRRSHWLWDRCTSTAGVNQGLFTSTNMETQKASSGGRSQSRLTRYWLKVLVASPSTSSGVMTPSDTSLRSSSLRGSSLRRRSPASVVITWCRRTLSDQALRRAVPASCTLLLACRHRVLSRVVGRSLYTPAMFENSKNW